MSETSSWRDLLRSFIAAAKERERLANEVGVTPITISRWANGNFEPRPQSLQRLVHVVPAEHREEFHALVAREYPYLANPASFYEPPELSGEFFRRVLETRCTTAERQLYWTITQQILEHGVRQLDPERVGISITVVRCMPPGADGEVHSLRENVGIGTPPWGSDFTARALFLGAESLAGYVVSSFHYENIDDLRVNRTFVPAVLMEHEVSSIAWPVLMAGRIAGCLLLSSTLPGYFNSEARRLLIADYARLLSLAFSPDQFYPYEKIRLRRMPSEAEQKQIFGHFQNRVTALMVERLKAGERIEREVAESIMWKQIESDLIEHMYAPEKG